MVNEDIVTALRNSIENGETLEQAIKILINSGYNSQEVQEASQFFSSGIITQTEPKPEEQLIMPEKKSFFSSFSKKSPKEDIIKEPLNNNVPELSPSINDTQNKDLAKQLERIHSPKQSHFKEIFLFILLLLLIGTLIVTMIYKNQIISYFS